MQELGNEQFVSLFPCTEVLLTELCKHILNHTCKIIEEIEDHWRKRQNIIVWSNRKPPKKAIVNYNRNGVIINKVIERTNYAND